MDNLSGSAKEARPRFWPRQSLCRLYRRIHRGIHREETPAIPVIVNLYKAKKLFYAVSILALLLSCTVLTAQQHHHYGAEGGDANAVLEKFGAVHMPISCAASVQVSFERGIAQLHSFWYEEALKQFQSVATADPQCAMAQWAIAMTEWRPFWDGMPDDRRKAGIVEID
jgi:hypothetical protein